MSFTAEDVRRLAKLARLELSPAEIDAFARQLAEILELARQVQTVDTAAIIAGAEHVLAPAAPAREDVVQPSLPADGLFKVPRVLNG